MRYFLAAILLLFLTGCSEKANKLTNGKEPIYAQHLKYTKVLKVMEEEDVKILATATYLNSVEEKWDNGKQNFIVSVYYPMGKAREYTFTLNDAAPVSVAKIEKEQQLYKNIAMRNDWIDYYLYSFENIEKIKIFKDIENEENPEEININTKSLKLVFRDETDSLTFSFIKE